MNRLVKLNDTYVVNLDRIQEVIFYPADGIDPAKTLVFMIDDASNNTTFLDDEAITTWHRLLDLLEQS